MATYNTGVLVNELTAIDTAFLAKWKNTLTVYPGDSKGRQKTLDARFEGPDEEFQVLNYDEWIILCMPFVWDQRRYNEDRIVSATGTTGVSGAVHKDIIGPDQPYLLTYVVNAYTQDHRVFREMQEFAARALPRHAYITANSWDHYVNTINSQSGFNYDEREFYLQITYQVWVRLELTDVTETTTVFNKVHIGYTTGQGRTDQGDESQETQNILF